MKTEKNELSEEDVHKVAELTDGYSGADMKNLCQEASLGPIRSIDFTQIGSIESHEVIFFKFFLILECGILLHLEFFMYVSGTSR